MLATIFPIASVVCFTAPLVFSFVSTLLRDGTLGAWSLLISPLVSFGQARLAPWLLPAGVLAAAGCSAAIIAIVVLWVLRRRHAVHGASS